MYKMLLHTGFPTVLLSLLIGAVLSQENNVSGNSDKFGPLQFTRAQFVVAVTFPTATVVGILFCLCLTKTLGIDSWQNNTKVTPKKSATTSATQPAKPVMQPRKTPRFSPTNSRVSSTSTATSSSYKHYSC